MSKPFSMTDEFINDEEEVEVAQCTECMELFPIKDGEVVSKCPSCGTEFDGELEDNE